MFLPSAKATFSLCNMTTNNTTELDEGLAKQIAAGLAGLTIGAATHMAKPPAGTATITPPAISAKVVQHAQQLLAHPNAQLLKSTAERAGIQGQALAAFLAQCAHESQNFTRLKEFGGRLDFRKYDPKFNPKKAQELGNKMPGDGMRYSGRGFIQITGRWNYNQLEKALNIPLVKHPELMEKPHIAARAAVWYWQNRVEPKVNNFDDVAATTVPINKGLKGLEDRKIKYTGLKHVLVKQPPAVNTAK